MAIKHVAVKASGERGYASEWNANHTQDGNHSAGGFLVTDLAAPVDDNDAARKIYIDNLIAGLGAGVVPVGGIIPWTKSVAGTPALPGEFVECNGQVISDAASPYNGLNAPALNGTTEDNKRFLRGALASGATGGNSTHGHGSVAVQGIGGSSAGTTAAGAHINPYYEVVLVWRIK